MSKNENHNSQSFPNGATCEWTIRVPRTAQEERKLLDAEAKLNAWFDVELVKLEARYCNFMTNRSFRLALQRD